MSSELLQQPKAVWAGAHVVLLGHAQHGRHSLTRSLSGQDAIEVIVVEPEAAA